MGPFMEAVCRIIRALGIYFAKTFGCCGRLDRPRCRRSRSSRGSEEKTESQSDDKRNGSQQSTEKKEKKKRYRKRCHKSDRSPRGSTPEQASDDNSPGTPGAGTAEDNPQQSPSTSRQNMGPGLQEAPSRPQSGDDVSQDYISLGTPGGFVGGTAQNALLCEQCVERTLGSNMASGPIIINVADFSRGLPGGFDEYLEELSQQDTATCDVNTVPSYIS